MPRWLGVLALLSGGASLALAQSPNDFIRMFDIPQDAIVQAATRSEWSKLSSTEIGCMDDALHQQGGSVEALIERAAIRPEDWWHKIQLSVSTCTAIAIGSGVCGKRLGSRCAGSIR